ncbi:MAG: SGNH/GDSL hydrolase family protein [Hyphomicrobiales bacterium]|nr:SGNH/GDSL hydrolase family protein [Hyphomicrobiales bacterium]
MQQLPALRVFFFGDSISFGQGVSPHKVWVNRIGESLSKEFEKTHNIIVQNPSINGNTTRMALERIAFDVQSHRPHILITEFGLNDCNVWESDKGQPRTSPDAFAANLREIIERGRNFGARRVIIGTNHPTTRTRVNLPNVDYTYETGNRRYNAIIREVASASGAELVDIEKAFERNVDDGLDRLHELLQSDELHLSERGHDVYYANYFPIVQAAVTSLVRDETSVVMPEII